MVFGFHPRFKKYNRYLERYLEKYDALETYENFKLNIYRCTSVSHNATRIRF